MGEAQVSSQKWKTILHVQRGGPWFKNSGANESISFRKVVMENCKIQMGYGNRAACLSMVYPVMVVTFKILHIDMQVFGGVLCLRRKFSYQV